MERSYKRGRFSATRDGLWLPGGEVGVRQTSPDVWAWELVNRYGNPQGRIQAISPVLAQNCWSAEAEAQALEKLTECSSREKQVLRYAGFIITYLYLERNTDNALETTDIAARLSRLLLRFWNEQEHTDEAAARLARPMLWQSYWRALGALLQRYEHLLGQEGYDGSDQDRARLLRSIRGVRAHRWLDGWGDILEAEHRRAQRHWREVCLQEQYTDFWRDWFCDWFNTAPDRMSQPDLSWQDVRNAELHASQWADIPELTTSALIRDVLANIGLPPHVQEHLATLLTSISTLASGPNLHADPLLRNAAVDLDVKQPTVQGEIALDIRDTTTGKNLLTWICSPDGIVNVTGGTVYGPTVGANTGAITTSYQIFNIHLSHTNTE